MSRSAQRQLENRLVVLVAHLLKWRFQPERAGGSWRRTIDEQRRAIATLLRRNPSLLREVGSRLDNTYERALRFAERDAMFFREVMPEICPFEIDQVLDLDFFPPFEEF